MATLTYSSHSVNDSVYGYDSRSSSYYNIDTQSIVKVEPLDPSYNNSAMSSRSTPSYSDISSSNHHHMMKQNLTSFTDSHGNLLSWTMKHPENWTESEILDWVYFVADENDFDGSKVCGEAYQNLSGPKLSNMTRDQFQKVDPSFGSTMYDLFRRLVDNASFSAPTKPETFTFNPIYDRPSHTTLQTETATDLPASGSNTVLGFNIDGFNYDFDCEPKNLLPEIEKTDLGYVSGDSDLDHSQTHWSGREEDNMDFTAFDLSAYNFHQQPKRRVPSHSVSSDEGERRHQGQQQNQETRCTSRQKSRTGGSKGNHLWEFVRDLLKDSKVNPSLLKWEDKATGVFRFVNSEAVAQMWGRKKNNRQMTYEKLSRAMRFCRSAGYFEGIPKNGKFPKKLCFKFGPKAHGWHD